MLPEGDSNPRFLLQWGANPQTWCLMAVRTTLLILGLIALQTAPVRAQGLDGRGPKSPGVAQEGWVPIEVSTERDSVGQVPCLRRAHRPGYQWVAGRRGDDGVWLQGHWQPLAPRPGQVWVPGHPGSDGRWVLGFWRAGSLVGFAWIDGYWLSGVWQHGHWSPLESRPGFVWVHGHVVGISWRIGQWRARARTGSTWVPAHWRRGAWMAGFWHVGVWVFGPHDIAIPYAQPLDTGGGLLREEMKKIVRPRYVAYLLTQGAGQGDDDSDTEASARGRSDSDEAGSERTPKGRSGQASEKTKTDSKRELKQKKRRPLLRRRAISVPRSGTRAKPVSRRRGGQR